MKNIAVINCIDCNEYSELPVIDGKSSIDRVLEVARGLPSVEKVIILSNPDFLRGENGTVLRKESWDIETLFSVLEQESRNFDHLFYLFGDTPLLDRALCEKMFQNHIRYFAGYTFADGYPYGLTPEIISTGILSALLHLAEGNGGKIARDTVFTVLQKDLNSFDIETEISPVDLRLLRIELCCDTKRNHRLTARVIDEGATDAKGVLNTVREKPEILRTLPAFFNIQIIDGCPQSCFYCPFPSFGGNVLKNRTTMSIEDFTLICKKIHQFVDDAVISVSLWGEPALHSEIDQIAALVGQYSRFSLVIETSGVGWKRESIDAIKKQGPEKISWIVSLDADDPRLYQQLRGDGMEEAVQTTEQLTELFPGRVYPQAMRMNINEDNLETFYRKWKERTDTIIIQKYDSFAGELPERKVTDLSPLNRFPCWHLKRDMAVLLDGTVPLCREDIKREYVLGNIFNDDIEQLWEQGERYYHRHIEENYNKLCEQCDEYYTFNF